MSFPMMHVVVLIAYFQFVPSSTTCIIVRHRGTEEDVTISLAEHIWVFFGYFLSVNVLQVTRFDPGNNYFENMIFRTISSPPQLNVVLSVIVEHMYTGTVAISIDFRSI